MNKYRTFFEGMAQAPVGQMDKSVLPKFKALAESDDPKADDLHEILDQCVHFSLCSNFCIRAMDVVWKAMLKDEGRTFEEAMGTRAQVRKQQGLE